MDYIIWNTLLLLVIIVINSLTSTVLSLICLWKLRDSIHRVLVCIHRLLLFLRRTFTYYAADESYDADQQNNSRRNRHFHNRWACIAYIFLCGQVCVLLIKCFFAWIIFVVYQAMLFSQRLWHIQLPSFWFWVCGKEILGILGWIFSVRSAC